jgi:hypothetical protein
MGKTYSRTFSVGLQVGFYPRGTSRDSGHSFAGIFPSPSKHDATVGDYFDVLATNDISSVGAQPMDATGTGINFRLDSHPTKHFHRSHRKGSQMSREGQSTAAAETDAAGSILPRAPHGVRGDGGGIFLTSGEQFPSNQPIHCSLHGTFR